MDADTPLPPHPFCVFAEAMCAQTDVDDALRALQAARGLNGQALLFCCWLAKTGRAAWTRDETHRALAVVAPWHERIVRVLDGMARRCKAEMRPPLLEVLRFAERIERRMLAEAVARLPRVRTDRQQLADACQSLAGYCRVSCVAPDAHDRAALHQVLQAVFPEVAPGRVAEVCRSALQFHRSRASTACTQTRLKMENWK